MVTLQYCIPKVPGSKTFRASDEHIMGWEGKEDAIRGVFGSKRKKLSVG